MAARSKVSALTGKHGTEDSAAVSVRRAEPGHAAAVAVQLRSEWVTVDVSPIESQVVRFRPSDARRLATALQKAADRAERDGKVGR